MGEGPEDIKRLKRRMAQILPLQLKGEFGLRAGEVRWIDDHEALLWLPEKLASHQAYEVRIDLREMGRTVDGTVTTTEVHNTRKLRLRPGYLIVATHSFSDPTHRAHLLELLARLRPGGADGPPLGGRVQGPEDSVSHSVTRSATHSAARRPDAARPAPPELQPPPHELLDEDPFVPEPASPPSVPSRSRAQVGTDSTSSRSRRRSGRVQRDALSLTPLGPPPTRRETREQARRTEARALGRIPLGAPPKRKLPPAPPAPVDALFSAGPPPSLFVRFNDTDQARGAIQGEPPELQVWLRPMEELLVGLRPKVAFQLPGGRFAELAGLVSSRNPERALLTFPDARAEDLHLLALARHR